MDSFRGLVDRATVARREWRLLDAHRDLTEALALSRQTQIPRQLIAVLKGLGQIERDLGHADAALPLYEEAVAICRSQDDALLLAHTIRHVGDIHQDEGHLDLAEPCYREALAIYRDNGKTEPLDLANTLRPFALLQESLGQINQAKELWAEARDLYLSVNVREGVAESTEHLSALGGQ